MSRTRTLWSVAALIWLIILSAVAAHQVVFWRGSHLNTDVLALLPVDRQSPEVALATRKLADAVSREVVVLLGAPDWQAAQRAAAAWRSHLAQGRSAPRPPVVNAKRNDASDEASRAVSPDRKGGTDASDGPRNDADEAGTAGEPLLRESARLDASTVKRSLDFYRPYRNRFLTQPQRERLAREVPINLVADAIATLYQPATGARLTDWAADPLGLWSEWWGARSADSKARPRGGEMWVEANGLQWVVLPYTIAGQPFALDGVPVYGNTLDAALRAAQSVVPEARMLVAGVPLHAEAAAVQAHREINTIGWGSLAAVLLLVWFAFWSFWPIVLVALSLFIGCAVALSVTALLFGQVHLLTLVFGASLVGVAEDFGIHYFASRQAGPDIRPLRMMRRSLPTLLLALSTSVLAYLALGIEPFPGLRQMAVFAAVGMVATFVTVVAWFPLLDIAAPTPTRLSTAISRSLRKWPRLTGSSRDAWSGLVIVLACAGGLAQLRARDDVRQLQSSPAALLESQQEVARLLDVASPAQFYLVRGKNVEQVLQREELLKTRLDAAVLQGRLEGYRAVSDWVPSISRQQADARLSNRVETAVIGGVNLAMNEALVRPAFPSGPLTLPAWLKSPVSGAARDLWIGDLEGQQASIVMLRGLRGDDGLSALEAAAHGITGVRWVDRTAETSSLLGRYRNAMSGVLLVGHAAVLWALWLRFRSAAWRAWLPAALASLMTLAVLGWMGEPLQLFNVLALVLLLGTGVDYGIFLLEHGGQTRAAGAAWLAVVLGAASTWLSFGLLALSNTPALRAFGLTLLFGIGFVWLLAPLFRPEPT